VIEARRFGHVHPAGRDARQLQIDFRLLGVGFAHGQQQRASRILVLIPDERAREGELIAAVGAVADICASERVDGAVDVVRCERLLAPPKPLGCVVDAYPPVARRELARQKENDDCSGNQSSQLNDFPAEAVRSGQTVSLASRLAG
jgi:hypothetical protein